MPKVVRKDVDNLNAVLSITLEKADYEPKLKAQLQNQRKKAHMKGFRKGKTPVGYIKKMYGRAILADIINELLQSELNKYLKESDVKVLGYPLPSEDQESYDFNLDALIDYTFSFDVGIAPEFEVQGLSASQSFSCYSIEVPKETIDKDMDMLRQRGGERASAEDTILEKDLVSFNADELDGNKKKENGWAATFTILVEMMDDAYKADILKKKKGDTIQFNIYKLEKDRTSDYVQKYLLGAKEGDDLSEIGEEFEATIADVSRIIPAELNAAFFDKTFGEGVVKTEEEARELIEKDVTKYYDKQAESLLFRDFQNHLLEKNQLPLPDSFMKRWIKSNAEGGPREISEKEYEGFAKNLRWSLIKSKLISQYDISVTDDEIVEHFKKQVRQYFGSTGDELVILNTANRLMQDEKQVDNAYQEILADRLFEAIKGQVKVKKEKVAAEKFDEIIKKARDEAQQQIEDTNPQGDPIEETEEVTEDVE